MIDEESIEIIASKIHLLQRSHFINLPLLPLLLLSDRNSPSSSNENNLSVCKNSANPHTTFTMKNCNDSVNKNKSAQKNHYHANDWSKLNNIGLLKHNSDTKEHSSFRRLLMTYWCPKSINGAQLLLDELKYSHCFSTGNDNLDSLLNGGLRTSEITEIIGKSCTGKTQFCLSLCASVLQKHKTVSIVYLDTKGDFIADRLQEYLNKRNLNKLAKTAPNNDYGTFNVENHNVNQCLTRIRCCLVPTIGHLIDTLTTIRMYIDKAQCHLCSLSTCEEEFFAKCKLIIIDSLAMPFLPYMSTLPQLAIAQLALIISELQRLSTMYHCAILVTNHARSQLNHFVNNHQVSNRNLLNLPISSIGCLGIHWSFIPNYRVLFECSMRNPTKITMKLLNPFTESINEQSMKL